MRIADTFRTLKQRFSRKGTPWIKGEFTVREYQNGQFIREVYRENIVVDGAGILAARLFKDSAEPSNGIYCMAVGTGDSGWDLQNPPAPGGSETSLFAEAARVPIQTSKFITPILGTVSVTPTNIIDLEFEFAEGIATGPLTELGLFGGDATLVANSGTQVTYKTFPVLNKPAASSFKFLYRLTF
jgi:hypothetical protein